MPIVTIHITLSATKAIVRAPLDLLLYVWTILGYKLSKFLRKGEVESMFLKHAVSHRAAPPLRPAHYVTRPSRRCMILLISQRNFSTPYQ